MTMATCIGIATFAKENQLKFEIAEKALNHIETMASIAGVSVEEFLTGKYDEMFLDGEVA